VRGIGEKEEERGKKKKRSKKTRGKGEWSEAKKEDFIGDI